MLTNDKRTKQSIAIPSLHLVLVAYIYHLLAYKFGLSSIPMVVQAESESIPVDTTLPVSVAVLELMLHMRMPYQLCNANLRLPNVNKALHSFYCRDCNSGR